MPLSITIHKLEKGDGYNLYLLREDLLPYAMGGNKVRIAFKLLEDAKAKNATCLIAYGNSRSNLCRVLSLLCARENLKCIVVSPSDDDGTRKETNNSRIVSRMGVEIVICPKDESIKAVLDNLIADLIQKGETPYYIYGTTSGVGNEYTHMSAYVDVAKKICDFEKANNISFSAVCLALGTGSTCAGLAAGFAECGRELPVTGFTIARTIERCRQSFDNFFKAFNLRYSSNIMLHVNINDKALGEGYGKASALQKALIFDALKKYSIGMDETYVGKAFCGVMQEIEQGNLCGNILFVHTGSLPLVFDVLNS